MPTTEQIRYLAGRFKLPQRTVLQILATPGYLNWWLRNTGGTPLEPGGIYDLARLRRHTYHQALDVLLRSAQALATHPIEREAD